MYKMEDLHGEKQLWNVLQKLIPKGKSNKV